MTSPLSLVNLDQPKQEKSSSFLNGLDSKPHNIEVEGKDVFHDIVRNRVKVRYNLIDDEYSLVYQ